MIVLDTNVLIEILKGNPGTLEIIGQLNETPAISTITAMELLYGALNKQELLQLEKFISHFEHLHLNEDISGIAFKLIRNYAKSHTLDIPDSLIAATAMYYKAALFSYNIKDFRFIPRLELHPVY
ncbi:MAG: type II toxin-antitoxin system VapC family toxin [Thiolinea sp.]